MSPNTERPPFIRSFTVYECNSFTADVSDSLFTFICVSSRAFPAPPLVCGVSGGRWNTAGPLGPREPQILDTFRPHSRAATVSQQPLPTSLQRRPSHCTPFSTTVLLPPSLSLTSHYSLPQHLNSFPVLPATLSSPLNTLQRHPSRHTPFVTTIRLPRSLPHTSHFFPFSTIPVIPRASLNPFFVPITLLRYPCTIPSSPSPSPLCRCLAPPINSLP